MKRTLTIRREVLIDLAPAELRDIAGAATREDSCHFSIGWTCPTVDVDCPTEPIRVCLSLNGCIQTL